MQDPKQTDSLWIAILLNSELKVDSCGLLVDSLWTPILHNSEQKAVFKWTPCGLLVDSVWMPFSIIVPQSGLDPPFRNYNNI